VPFQRQPTYANLPGLTRENHRVTSDWNFNNNGIAWAVGDKERWWDDFRGCYWPDKEAESDTVEGWLRIFALSGYYEFAGSGDLEDGFEKVAIYVKDGEPSHAAHQLESGAWSSKLAFENDIEHDSLGVLEGNFFGEVAHILKRRRRGR
jgi:hypothetical protein